MAFSQINWLIQSGALAAKSSAPSDRPARTPPGSLLLHPIPWHPRRGIRKRMRCGRVLGEQWGGFQLVMGHGGTQQWMVFSVKENPSQMDDDWGASLFSGQLHSWWVSQWKLRNSRCNIFVYSWWHVLLFTWSRMDGDWVWRIQVVFGLISCCGESVRCWVENVPIHLGTVYSMSLQSCMISIPLFIWCICKRTHCALWLILLQVMSGSVNFT